MYSLIHVIMPVILLPDIFMHFSSVNQTRSHDVCVALLSPRSPASSGSWQIISVPTVTGPPPCPLSLTIGHLIRVTVIHEKTPQTEFACLADFLPLSVPTTDSVVVASNNTYSQVLRPITVTSQRHCASNTWCRVAHTDLIYLIFFTWKSAGLTFMLQRLRHVVDSIEHPGSRDFS